MTIIINPNSGTLSKKDLDRWLPRRVENLGYDVSVEYTAGPGDATRIAAKCADRGDYGVLACGGDGTINEVATGLINTSTALGILPAGSGNGLARHIGIPVDVSLSLSVIAEDNIKVCDYGTVNGRPFFCTFGMGFDAAVSHRFASKKRRGLNSYVRSAIDEFIKYHPKTYEILIDGQTLTDRAFLVAVCNASQYGNNAFIAPKASLTDGLLDVITIHDGNLFDKARAGVDIITGAVGNHGSVKVFRTSSLKIRSEEVSDSHIDGDPVIFPNEVDIECHPGGLRIFMPKNEIKFIPLITPFWLSLHELWIVLSRPFRRH